MLGIDESIDPISTFCAQTAFLTEDGAQTVDNFVRHRPVLSFENFVLEIQRVDGNPNHADEGLRQPRVTWFDSAGFDDLVHVARGRPHSKGIAQV